MRILRFGLYASDILVIKPTIISFALQYLIFIYLK